MSNAARLPIVAPRVGACVRTILFRGVDLTGATFELQMRLIADTPGLPLIDLTMQPAGTEGISVGQVTQDANGVPSTPVVIRISEATMKDPNKVPYMGELGDPGVIAYALVASGGALGADKRLMVYGELIAQASAYGSDNAPAGRAPSFQRMEAWASTNSATVQWDAGTIVQVSIDGVDLLASYVSQAKASAAATARDALATLADRQATQQGAAGALRSATDAAAYLNAVQLLAGTGPLTGTLTIQATSRAILAAIAKPPAGTIVYMSEAGRAGFFMWVTSDQSMLVTLDPLQAIYVAPATDTTGASGAWVRVFSSGTLKASWYGAVGDDATVNTAAIQGAINFACYLGAASIEFGVGSYLTGPLTCPGYGNTADGWRSIEFVGATMPVYTFGTVPSTAKTSKKGTVLRCLPGQTKQMISFPDGPYDGFSVYMLSLRRMTWRTYDNPQCTAVDASNAIQLITEDVQIDTGVYSPFCTDPTNASAYGLIPPLSGNAAVTILKGSLAVSGYYVGYRLYEHTHGEYVNLTGNKIGLQVEFANDASHFTRLCTQQNQTNIAVNGHHVLYIDEWNIEKTMTVAGAAAIGIPAYQATVYDIDDPTNSLLGKANVHLVLNGIQGGSSVDDFFTSRGSENFLITPVGEPENRTSSHYTTSVTSVPSATQTPLAFKGTFHAGGFKPKQVATFTGSTNGNTLTVSNVMTGQLAVGQILADLDSGAFPAIPTIVALGTGAGQSGTYTLDTASNLSSRNMGASDPTLLLCARSGNYVVTAQFNFTGNPSGYRAGLIQTVAADGTASTFGQDGRTSFGADPTYFSAMSPWQHISAGTSVRVLAYQNSGATLNIDAGNSVGWSGRVSIERRGVLQ